MVERRAMNIASFVFKDYCGRSATILVSNIIYFKAELKYVTVQTVEGKSWVIDDSLTSLEESLPSFVRTHRAYLVNPLNVSGPKRVDKTSWELREKANPLLPVPISRRKLEYVQQRFSAV